MKHFSSIIRERHSDQPAFPVVTGPAGPIASTARASIEVISTAAIRVPVSSNKNIKDRQIATHEDLCGAAPDDPESGIVALAIAELQRAKAAAESANEAKTRYLVAVSHEMRSPLNAIYGYAQLLERDGMISAAEAGGVIKRSAEHLTNLIEGILEISRIESGVLEVRTEVVELRSLLAHLMDMFRMQAKAKGLELRYDVTGRLPRFVRTDEKRLRQILINLLSNAIKYTREGSVTLSVAYRSQVAEISIADTGIGIPAEELELIFDPFERGSSAEAALQPGIGLGLAITRALSRILGGEIVATSTLGVGSRFSLRIFLPEPFTPPVDAADYKQVIGYQGSRRTVLVIDDDLSQINIIDSLLRQLDFVVYTACTGAEGLALAERCQPDLVLLDIRMPGISGWEVAAKLRQAYGDAIRIVMVSAEAHEAGVIGEASPSHDAFLAKPVAQKKLLAVIGYELKLTWDVAGNNPMHGIPETAPAATLPKVAVEAVRRIRQLAEVGHIRAVEAALIELEAAMPAGAPALVAMRKCVSNFDLRSLMKLLDGYLSQ